jgi:heptosyltransferase-2
MRAGPPRFLIFRNGSIGNTLVAVPAIRAIRKAFPDAHLSLILDSTGASLLKNCPLVNEILVYDKRGKHRGIPANLSFIRQLRQRHPTHAVLFKRFFRNGLLAFLSGANDRTGYETNGSAPFLNRTTPYEEGKDIVELNLQLAFLLGAENSASRDMELWFDDETVCKGREFLNERGLKDNGYAAVCLGGITSPPDYLSAQEWQEIVRRIADFCHPLVFLGVGTEKSLAESVADTLPDQAHFGFDLPILVTAEIIRSARLFAGTNSGPAHMARAVGTPGLIFFRPEKKVTREIEKWCPKGPLYRALVPPTDRRAMGEFLRAVEEAASEVLK